MNRPDCHHRQNGVALITAILLTAIATTAAVSMAARQHVDLRRSSNVFDNDQALLFADGVETWAGEVLMRDRQDGPVDQENEDWATILPPISVEGGMVAGRIEDLQGRFNINNLVRDGKVSQPDVSAFRRLLDILDIDTVLVDRVIDWLDTDVNVTFPNGAEDNRYLSYQVPYRTANHRMASPSELLLIDGMTMEIYNKLSPYVIALPVRTAVNVNTASPELLMAMIDGLNRADAERLISDRGDKGYTSVEAFVGSKIVKPLLEAEGKKLKQQTAQSGSNLPGGVLPNVRFSVGSDYFLVIASSSFGRAQIDFNSIINRSARSAKVIMRARGAI